MVHFCLRLLLAGNCQEQQLKMLYTNVYMFHFSLIKTQLQYRIICENRKERLTIVYRKTDGLKVDWLL